MSIKNIVFKILILFQVHKIVKYLKRDQLTIIAFHGFTDHRSSGVENYLGLHIPRDLFRQQLMYLKDNYKIITLDEAVKIMVDGKKYPPNSVVLTADDGYQSNYTLAFPVLKELSVPMTIFLTTEFVDRQIFLWTDRLEYAINSTSKKVLVTDGMELELRLSSVSEKLSALKTLKKRLKTWGPGRRNKILDTIEEELGEKLEYSNSPDLYKPLTWNEIREMKDSSLVQIGSHTHTHPILSKCNDEEINEELKISKRLIEEQISKKCETFAYPNGQAEDFDKRVIKSLKINEYRCALSTIYGKNNYNTNLFSLKRLYSSSSKDITVFIMIMAEVSSLFKKFKNKFK